MRTVIISDIHGKANILREVLNRHPDDPVVCLGDALGSGDNETTLSLLQEHQVPCVKGNHEVDLIHLYELSPNIAAHIDSWPYIRNFGDVLFVHTWLELPQIRYRMIDSLLSAEEMFSSNRFKTAFVGHSHSPGWWTLEEHRPVWKHAKTETVLELDSRRRIVDVGSLGEPYHPEDPRYVIWEEGAVRWKGLT